MIYFISVGIYLLEVLMRKKCHVLWFVCMHGLHVEYIYPITPTIFGWDYYIIRRAEQKLLGNLGDLR